MRTMTAILMFLMTASSPISAQETINWLQADFPPYLFTTRGSYGQGLCDTAFIKAQELLSQYNNQIHPVSLSRFLKMMKNKQGFCYSCLLKNRDREKFIIFSKPYAYTAGNQLVTRSKEAHLYQPYVDQSGSIDLNELLRRKRVVLSITHGRSYGEHIDAIIDLYRGTSTLDSTSGKSSIELIVRRLFTMNAYHAILGYAPEVVYHAKKLGIDIQQFKLYPVRGLKPFDSRTYIYFGCSKGKLGEEVIKIINDHIGILRDSALTSYRQWLDNDTHRLHVAYEEIFIQEDQ